MTNIESIIKEVFNKHYQGQDDYEESDVNGIMVDEIIEILELNISSFNIEKLTKEDIENISDEEEINRNTFIKYYKNQVIVYILINILDRLHEGKSITRQIKKWFD